MKIKTHIIFCVCVLLLLSACEKQYISSIPDYPVFLKIDLRISPYSLLKNSSNQYFVFEQPRPNEFTDRIGFGGIIVYSGFDENFYAFDLACPHEAKDSVKVQPNGLGQMECASCNSVFDISYGIGNPVEGPANEPLKRYKVSQEGDYLLVTRK